MDDAATISGLAAAAVSGIGMDALACETACKGSLWPNNTEPFSEMMRPGGAILTTKFAEPTECSLRSTLLASHSTTPATEHVAEHCANRVFARIVNRRIGQRARLTQVSQVDLNVVGRAAA